MVKRGAPHDSDPPAFVAQRVKHPIRDQKVGATIARNKPNSSRSDRPKPILRQEIWMQSNFRLEKLEPFGDLVTCQF